MAKVFNFQNEEVCECPICRLEGDFTEFILNAESAEEVAELVSDVIDIARSIGYEEALHDDIQAKIETLGILNGKESCDCCEECCDECDLD